MGNLIVSTVLDKKEEAKTKKGKSYTKLHYVNKGKERIISDFRGMSKTIPEGANVEIEITQNEETGFYDLVSIKQVDTIQEQTTQHFCGRTCGDISKAWRYCTLASYLAQRALPSEALQEGQSTGYSITNGAKAMFDYLVRKDVFPSDDELAQISAAVQGDPEFEAIDKPQTEEPAEEDFGGYQDDNLPF